MRKGRASNTAQFVAFNRALGDLSPEIEGFSDPIAARLLPPKWTRRVARAQRRLPRSPLPFWMRGMALFNQFRTVVLDRAVLAALPFDQLVILGAGLDGRAFRLEGLRDATVYEVDHPSTQRTKQERTTPLSPLAKAVRFVPVDFTVDDLSARLAEAGFDPLRKTFWLWEGVTMYLEAADVQKTLSTLARLSAPGSRVALTYMGKTPLRLTTRVFLVFFGLMTGEPMRSSFTAGDLQALAGAAGWDKLANTGIEEWKPALAPKLVLTARQVGLQWNERIWVGARPPEPASHRGVLQADAGRKSPMATP
ncbi:MAG TPA: SAM-dependent methyltransferase [Myxococcales bacterium]|nr:SAM-dependent methyltransferase [Myxococcales bacterium]